MGYNSGRVTGSPTSPPSLLFRICPVITNLLELFEYFANDGNIFNIISEGERKSGKRRGSQIIPNTNRRYLFASSNKQIPIDTHL